MNPIFIDRLQAADLTGSVITEIFKHLETIMHESSSGQAALTLGYISPDDKLNDGELVPTINIVLTQYHRNDIREDAELK